MAITGPLVGGGLQDWGQVPPYEFLKPMPGNPDSSVYVGGDPSGPYGGIKGTLIPGVPGSMFDLRGDVDGGRLSIELPIPKSSLITDGDLMVDLRKGKVTGGLSGNISGVPFTNFGAIVFGYNIDRAGADTKPLYEFSAKLSGSVGGFGDYYVGGDNNGALAGATVNLMDILKGNVDLADGQISGSARLQIGEYLTVGGGLKGRSPNANVSVTHNGIGVDLTFTDRTPGIGFHTEIETNMFGRYVIINGTLVWVPGDLSLLLGITY